MKYFILSRPTEIQIPDLAGEKVRLYVDGNYPIVMINDTKESEPKSRDSYFELSPDGSSFYFKCIGGNSILRAVKVINNTEFEYQFEKPDTPDSRPNLPFVINGQDVTFKGNIRASNFNVSSKYVVGDALLTSKAIDDGIVQYISTLENQLSAKIALLEYRIKQLEDKNE